MTRNQALGLLARYGATGYAEIDGLVEAIQSGKIKAPTGPFWLALARWLENAGEIEPDPIRG